MSASELKGPSAPAASQSERSSNAFCFNPAMCWWERPLYVFPGIILIPLRVLLSVILAVLCLLYLSLCRCLPASSSLRRRAVLLGFIFPRTLLFFFGFWYIPVIRLLPDSSPANATTPMTKNRKATSKSTSPDKLQTPLKKEQQDCEAVESAPSKCLDPAPVIVCNHTNFLDSMVLMAQVMPSFLAKSSVFSVPVIAGICRVLETIGVDRETAQDRTESRDRMQRHVNAFPSTPPLLIFPEGTTSRENVLIRFKTGAFSLRKSVQPVVLVWHQRDFDFGTLPTTPLKLWFLRVFGQLYHTVSVVYLPVYHPSADEINDPRLYATNVRAKMLTALQTYSTPSALSKHDKVVVCSTELSTEDFFVWKRLTEVRKPRVPDDGLLTYSLFQFRVDLSAWASGLGGPVSRAHGGEEEATPGNIDDAVNSSEVGVLIKRILTIPTLTQAVNRYSAIYAMQEPGGAVFKRWPDAQPRGYVTAEAFAASFGLDERCPPGKTHNLFAAFAAPLCRGEAEADADASDGETDADANEDAADRGENHDSSCRRSRSAPLNLLEFSLCLFVHSPVTSLWDNPIAKAQGAVIEARAELIDNLANAFAEALRTAESRVDAELIDWLDQANTHDVLGRMDARFAAHSHPGPSGRAIDAFLIADAPSDRHRS